MNRSESIKELAAALANAQAAMRGASKDASNPMFRSKYATLASIWDAAREPLTSNGLSVVQTPEPSEPGLCTLTTLLIHTSGEWISSTMSVPVLPNVVAKGEPPVQTAQGYGSALTYARRYALAAIVGIAPDDDDANGASYTPAPKPTPKPVPAPKQNRAKLLDRIAELGGDVASASSMTPEQIVEYGKQLRAQQESLKATVETTTEEPGDGSIVTVSGTVNGNPYVSEKVCKFALVDRETGVVTNITVFPKRTCWHQVVSNGSFAVADDEAVEVTGKLQKSEEYGDSIIADSIEFV